MRRVSYFLLITLFLWWCAAAFARPEKLQQATADSAALSEDESGVYTTVFSSVFQITEDNTLVLVDHTSIGVPPGMWTVTSVQGQETSKFLAKLSPDVRQDYQLKSKQSVRLPAVCHLAPQCTVADVVTLTAIIGSQKTKMEKGWKEFNKLYPRAPGIFVVSRIGFNRDHNEAVVYAARSCGTLCGNGLYVSLVKRNGGWEVSGQTTVWMA